MTPARKITLTHRQMQSWEMILAEINRYINPQNTATRLYVLLLLGLSVVVVIGSKYVSVCNITASVSLDT